MRYRESPAPEEPRAFQPVALAKPHPRALTYKNLTELRRRGARAVQEGDDGQGARYRPADDLQLIVTVSAWALACVGYEEAGMTSSEVRRQGHKVDLWCRDAEESVAVEISLCHMDIRGIVGEVICRRFKIRLSRASVGRLMRRLGLSAERPLWRAYQQDPKR